MYKMNNKKTAAKETKKAVNGKKQKKEGLPKELNGPKGLEPTRYGDWEKNGRCVDF